MPKQCYGAVTWMVPRNNLPRRHAKHCLRWDASGAVFFEQRHTGLVQIGSLVLGLVTIIARTKVSAVQPAIIGTPNSLSPWKSVILESEIQRRARCLPGRSSRSSKVSITVRFTAATDGGPSSDRVPNSRVWLVVRMQVRTDDAQLQV